MTRKGQAEMLKNLPEDTKVLTLAGAAEELGRSRQWGHANGEKFSTARRIPYTTTVIVDREEVESMKGTETKEE